MSYLFSWRGYREMILRWRSVLFQPFFFFSSVLWERENGSVAPGKAGQNIKSFHASFQPVTGQTCNNRAHVIKRGSSLTLIFVSLLSIKWLFERLKSGLIDEQERYFMIFIIKQLWHLLQWSLNHFTLSQHLHITNCNDNKATSSFVARERLEKSFKVVMVCLTLHWNNTT